MRSTSYWAIVLIALILILDFTSKLWVQSLPLMQYSAQTYPYGGIGVFKNFMGIEFSVTHATNKGAAWGILSEWQNYLLYLRITLVASLLIYLFAFNKHPKWEIPLALIVAGATGNILDYFVYGHVVDMFHFVFWGYDYPVFNVADAAIFLGVISLLIISFFEKLKQPHTI